MVVRKDKKSRKLRGSRTHGYGRVGQHRKAGSRGGRGAAGLHKHKWTWVVKYHPDWFGKHGFKNPNPTMVKEEIKAINLKELSEKVKELLQENKLRIENNLVMINLEELGYNKLLGGGNLTRPMKIVTPRATKAAIEKVKEAGGEVVVTTSQQ
ncbi:MAG: uL15 family ribosomal protein [Desulfurococcaceae archaeon TW002]